MSPECTLHKTWLPALAVCLLIAACGRVESEPPADRGGTKQVEVDEDTPGGSIQDGRRVIEMKARKFEFVPSTVVVREGESVRLKATSTDTLHGLRIEARNIDRSLHPEEEEVIDFNAGSPGRYEMMCSIYCGSGHDSMRGELIVLEAEKGASP